jgi:hypothetical protein
VSDADDSLELYTDPSVIVGVWADRTVVHRGRNEFTVDFIRQVPDPPGRVLVARAVMAPNVAADLRDQLDETWRGYHEWSMPESER